MANNEEDWEVDLALQAEEEEARRQAAEERSARDLARLESVQQDAEAGPSFTVSEAGLLSRQMAAARHAKVLCDVEIRVGDKVFPAHRFPLMMGSPVLRTRFTSLVGYGGESDRATLVLEGIEPHIFETVLGFLYTSSAALDPDNLMPTLFAADMLQAAHPGVTHARTVSVLSPSGHAHRHFCSGDPTVRALHGPVG